MAKTITYRVINNRLQFKCPSCQARKLLALPRDVRRKSVRCHKCGELAHCLLNRRLTPRESQTGKAVMIFGDGREALIDLYDISPGGVGFDIVSGGSGISLSQEVRLKCSFNPRLLDGGRFVVKSIKGRRIGVESTEKRYL